MGPSRMGLAVTSREMPAPELSAVAVSKRFGGVCAVDDVTFTVQKGEIVSLIGPNGAGKTSLLNMISGFFRPDSGSILLEDLNITRRRPSEIARLGIARTFQNIALFSGLYAPAGQFLPPLVVGQIRCSSFALVNVDSGFTVTAPVAPSILLTTF